MSNYNMRFIMEYIFYIFILQLIIYSKSEPLTVKLLGVVFRHGDRVPDSGRESYPNDPYKNDSYYPLIHGELNNSGKQHEFNLGIQLRKEYDDFLGDIYYHRDVFARSTDYRRTKMSLQLVLSGLYPPKKTQIWNPYLNWQPTITTYVHGDYDNLLIPEECPQFLKELETVQKLPEIQQKLKDFGPLLKNLTNLTGKLINTSTDMYDLYNSLSAQKSMGLELPRWAEDMIPDGPLLDGILFNYKIVHYNEKLLRLNGGMILRHLVENMKNIQQNKKTPKVHLLSGHETNVVAILNTLKVFKPHVPEYSSAVVVELLQNNTSYFVKIRYYKGIPSESELEDLKIPGCTILCPFEQFMPLMKNMIPTDDEMICKKTGSLYRVGKPEY
ncbi:venom acid phosphatase Acph-1-like [Chelonus insularis]|uniref:venom acid phosphatase Acph-1-like n=1 Tax=Chelonus insularis TaxID=460826 RepID=UPI0015884911|nr:venom acid phosphatase Acph-1-like [Chelonus insularis]